MYVDNTEEKKAKGDEVHQSGQNHNSFGHREEEFCSVQSNLLWNI